jgi:hypothetical protein
MNARGCTRSCRTAAEWIAPSAGLALIPKCPACVAAYVATLTGLGISIPMASGIRWGLIILCIVALTFVAARQGMRWIKWENHR